MSRASKSIVWCMNTWVCCFYRKVCVNQIIFKLEKVSKVEKSELFYMNITVNAFNSKLLFMSVLLSDTDQFSHKTCMGRELPR